MGHGLRAETLKILESLINMEPGHGSNPVTSNPNMEVWKMIFLFIGVIFRVHVNFQWSMCQLKMSSTCWKSPKSHWGKTITMWTQEPVNFRGNLWYSWWKTSCTTRDVWNLAKNGIPIGSMYGIFTYIYPKKSTKCSKCTIHGPYGIFTISTRWPDFWTINCITNLKMQRKSAVRSMALWQTNLCSFAPRFITSYPS